MLRIIYLTCLILALVALIGSAILIVSFLGQIDENSGNAGAFIASLSMGIGILGIGVLTIFGLVGASVGYVYEDKLPSGVIYKYWWPASLAAPGVLLILFSAGKVIVSGF